MKIASGLNGLMLSRVHNNNFRTLSVSTRRLSSGLRINSARDDAAGLAISERFTSQIRGMSVGQRNLNDAVSLLQVAEGGLSEVSGMLQRMRELAVRASNSGTIGANERKMLQIEVDELTQEIQSTFNKTEFNDNHILTPLLRGRVTQSSGGDGTNDLIYALKSTWMEQATDLVDTWYGLSVPGGSLKVEFNDLTNSAAYGAYLTAGTYDGASGLSDELTLTIDLDGFQNAAVPNGGSGPVYYDRIIAREMTKAVLHRNIDTTAVPAWFLEGAGELISGGDERVALDGGVASVMAQDITTWSDTSAMRSKSYLAVRYINDVLRTNGATMEDLFAELKGNAASPGAKYLFDAINTVAGLSGGSAFNSEGSFMARFATYASGNYLSLDLTNTDDVGAIGGFEASGAGMRDTSAENVIPDIEGFTDDPTNFSVTFPSSSGTGATTTGVLRSQGQLQLDFQYGANVSDKIQINLKQFSTSVLGIDQLDLVGRAQEAIVLLDKALDQVSSSRARFGAQMNRVEHMISQLQINHESYSASRSRVSDADYAEEMSAFTRTMLLTNASSSLMTQANSNEELVLNLLRNTLA